MRKLTVACVAAATLAMAPALAWADYAWRPTVSFRDYYAYYYTDHYAYYYPPVVAPDARYWSRGHRRRLYR